MSAAVVAEVIGALDGAAWMPQVSHWEIARTDGVWGAHAELDEGSVSPVQALAALASEVGSELIEPTEYLRAVDFTYRDVPVRVWWLRPGTRWIRPERCATCSTSLGDPGVSYVRLGEGDRSAPVICVPCRDRMQREWVGRQAEMLAAAERTASEMVGEQGDRIGELEAEVERLRSAARSTAVILRSVARRAAARQWPNPAMLQQAATSLDRVAGGVSAADLDARAEAQFAAEAGHGAPEGGVS